MFSVNEYFRLRMKNDYYTGTGIGGIVSSIISIADEEQLVYWDSDLLD